MALLEEVNQGIAESMKAHDQTRLAALRMLKTALVNRSVEKGRALDQSEALQVVSTLIKQRRESIEQFTRGGRADLAEKEAAEITVLERYLPPPVDAAEIERTVEAAIAETGASSAKDLGRVMRAVMVKLTGRGVDGKTVNDLVRRRLGG